MSFHREKSDLYYVGTRRPFCSLLWARRRLIGFAEPRCQKTPPAGRQPNRFPLRYARSLSDRQFLFLPLQPTLEAEHSAEILARTTGIARQLMTEEGDLVEKDQVLLQLENEDQRLNLKQAKLNLEKLRKDHQRQEKMHASGILSPQDFSETQNALALASAEVEKAQLALSYTEIKAPFSGQIIHRHIDNGAHVQPGTMLFEIMDVNPLLAKIHIPANRMGNLALGQDLELYLESTGTKLKGFLRLLSPVVDPTTGTVKVTAEIRDYPPNTRPGDFAEIKIITSRREDAMLVPSVAVFEEKGSQVLYTVVDGKAVRRSVETGFVEQGETEILSGIQATDIIVIKGQRNLRDGVPVEVLEGPPDAMVGHVETTTTAGTGH